MPFAARLLDPALHPGVIAAPCAATVRINGKAAARMGDTFTCALPPLAGPHPPNVIASGSATVLIEKKPAARVGDKTGCGAFIATGSINVSIGG